MKAQAIVTSQGRSDSLDIAVNYCHDMKLFKMSRRNIGHKNFLEIVSITMIYVTNSCTSHEILG